MKKVTILLLAVITVMACKKEMVQEALAPKNVQTGFNPKLEDIKPLILAFKEAAELSNYGTSKTSAMEDKTLAEAEWTLEGALNYDNAHPIQLYEGMHTDTLTITVSNAGTNADGDIMVDGDDLAQAYANLLVAINNLVPTGEDVEVVDIEAISHNNQFTTFKARINSGQTLTLAPDYVKPDDDWKAGENLGKCNGTLLGTDAAGRISSILNFNIANGYVQNFSGYTNGQIILLYTSVEQKQTGNQYGSAAYNTLLGQSNDPFSQIGPFGNSRLAASCVISSEMASYVANAWSSASALQPNGKDIIQILIKDNPYLDMTTGNVYVDHELHHVNYGIPVIL